MNKTSFLHTEGSPIYPRLPCARTQITNQEGIMYSNSENMLPRSGFIENFRIATRRTSYRGTIDMVIFSK